MATPQVAPSPTKPQVVASTIPHPQAHQLQSDTRAPANYPKRPLCDCTPGPANPGLSATPTVAAQATNDASLPQKRKLGEESNTKIYPSRGPAVPPSTPQQAQPPPAKRPRTSPTTPSTPSTPSPSTNPGAPRNNPPPTNVTVLLNTAPTTIKTQATEPRPVTLDDYLVLQRAYNALATQKASLKSKLQESETKSEHRRANLQGINAARDRERVQLIENANDIMHLQKMNAFLKDVAFDTGLLRSSIGLGPRRMSASGLASKAKLEKVLRAEEVREEYEERLIEQEQQAKEALAAQEVRLRLEINIQREAYVQSLAKKYQAKLDADLAAQRVRVQSEIAQREAGMREELKKQVVEEHGLKLKFENERLREAEYRRTRELAAKERDVASLEEALSEEMVKNEQLEAEIKTLEGELKEVKPIGNVEMEGGDGEVERPKADPGGVDNRWKDETIDALHEQLATADRDLDSLRAELASASDQLDSLRLEHTSTKEELSRTHQLLSDSQNARSSLELELENLTAKTTAFETKLLDSRLERGAIQNRSADEASMLLREFESSKTAVDHLTEQWDASEKERARVQRELEDLGTKYRAAAADKAHLEGVARRLVGERDALHDENDRIVEENLQLKNANATLSTDLSHLTAQLVDTQSLLAAAQEENEHLTRHQTQLRSEVLVHQARLDDENERLVVQNGRLKLDLGVEKRVAFVLQQQTLWLEEQRNVWEERVGRLEMELSASKEDGAVWVEGVDRTKNALADAYGRLDGIEFACETPAEGTTQARLPTAVAATGSHTETMTRAQIEARLRESDEDIRALRRDMLEMKQRQSEVQMRVAVQVALAELRRGGGDSCGSGEVV